MEKWKLIYRGIYPITLFCSGFAGDVKPGDEVEVMEPSYSEMVADERWESVKESKKKTEKGE